MRPGTLAPEPLCTVDPVRGFERPRDAVGQVLPSPVPHLVETELGIEVYRHPMCLLLEQPELWRAWTLFKAGLRIEHLAAADFFTWPNLLLEQLSALWAADVRRVERTLKDRAELGAEDPS